MEVVDDEGQISLTIDDDEISDAGSVVDETSAPREQFGVITREGMVHVGEGSMEHELIKKAFLTGMGSMAKDIDVVAIHKNCVSSMTKKARLDSHRIFSEAVARKCGGNANPRYAWYGGARDELLVVVKHGFSQVGRPSRGPSYGVGLQLSSAKFSIDGASSSPTDEDGLRHILLCRVILGNTEVIWPGSRQSNPSSENFDSGVDDVSAPRRYVIWSAFMNSYVLPAFLVTFKAPACLDDFESVQASLPKPTTPRMSIPSLISVLSQSLNPSLMARIEDGYKDMQDLKITRRQFVQMLRQIAGDEMLADIVRTHAQVR